MQRVPARFDSRHELMSQFAAHARNHPYLAFTVNSICDRDCTFCKPRCMEDYGPKDHPLQVGDYSGIAAEAGAWGIRKAHLSGGEPTPRSDIVEIVAALRSGLGPDARIGITTHGNFGAVSPVERLHEVGLSYINEPFPTW